MYKQIVFSVFLLISMFYMANQSQKRIIENDYTQSVIAILENSLIIQDTLREFNAKKAESLLNNWCKKNYSRKKYSIEVEEYKEHSKSYLEIDFYLQINIIFDINRVDIYEIAGKTA